MMLETKTRDTSLAARLAQKARRLALAHAANRLLARREDPARWRKATLLWPNLGGDR